MSTDTLIPQFTMADRLRKARDHAGLSSQEMAERIGVKRNTITNYEKGRTTPTRGVVLAWSMVTGVPVGWIEGESVTARYGLELHAA